MLRFEETSKENSPFVTTVNGRSDEFKVINDHINLKNAQTKLYKDVSVRGRLEQTKINKEDTDLYWKGASSGSNKTNPFSDGLMIHSREGLTGETLLSAEGPVGSDLTSL